MRLRAMLEKVNALPGAEHHPAAGDRDRQRCLGERALDVRRHVVGPLGAMNEQRIAIRHEPLEKGDEVALHIGIGVFLDQQRCRRMPAKDVCKACYNARRCNDMRRFLRKFGQALAVCIER